MEARKEPVLKDKIRVDIIFHVIIKNWRKYILPVFLTALITALLSLCIPRYYRVQVLLAPEYSNSSGSMGGISGLASMVGINLGSLNSSDAIVPMFYPDLMKSTDFLVPLLDVNVTTEDSTFSGTYLEYLTKKTTAPFWTTALVKLKRIFKKPERLNTDSTYQINPFKLTVLEDKILEGVSSSINCVVDKKTDVISISVTAQDPLVAAQLADTIKGSLQNFIIGYRTKKANIDLEHIIFMCDEAQTKYLQASRAYSDFVEKHEDIVLQSYRVKQEQLQNEMQNAFSVYNSLLQQKVVAESKLMERTPAFTTLQNASVPVKHAGPKRMITVLAMTILSFIITTIVLINKRK